MPEFQNMLCWTPEIARATISTDAIRPSSAVFLATHAPLRIRQARIQGRDLVRQDTEISEREVLYNFLERKPDTGTLLMPIVGDSGSGKSHLVRWVRENIRGDDRYQVIYLEKSRTSLKAVIEELLTGVQDDSLDNLRADINSFSSGLDKTALARRLVNALNEALAATSPRDMPQGPARSLAGPRGLAAILQDPYIQEHMLASDKLIPTLASQLLSNRAQGAPDRAPGFALSDLPLSVDDINAAARVSKVLLGKMMSSPDLQNAAVDLLNHHLELAVRSVANLGSGRLLEAMLQVREAYARQNKEIVLLIEDFALIQGVQGELLDSLTEPAIRGGRQRYAPMRTLMAVTTGYFRKLPETVMTRVSAATSGYVYDVDRVFSHDNDGGEQIVSFVGRYLNAARLGYEELEKAGTQTIPNRCTACEFRKTCHEAFGSSGEEYGLYPFNEAALKRMVHSVAPSNQPWAFIPRTVLGNIVVPILVDHAYEIASGEFPSKRVKERFRTASIDTTLSTALEGEIDSIDKISPDRRKVLLEFWGDSPSDTHGINPTLLTAFGIKALPDGEGARPRQGKSARVDRDQRFNAPLSTDKLSRSQQQKIQAIEDWAQRNEVLPQNTAGELRAIIVDAVFRRYDWSSPLMREMSRTELRTAWPRDSTVVSIEGSSQRLPGTDHAPINFKRNPVNSQFFQSLYLAKEGTGREKGEHLRRLAKLADYYKPKLAEAVVRHLEISDEELTIGIRASLIGAALAGRAWPGMDEADLLSTFLDHGSTWQRNDLSLRTDRWSNLLSAHLQNRGPLIERLRAALGIAQGTGVVRMIDASRALPLLRDAQRSWTWEVTGEVPSWVKPAVRGFGEWHSLALEQFDALDRLIAEIRQIFIRGENGKESVKAVRSAWAEAEKVGLAPESSQRERLRRLLEAADSADWAVVARVEDDLLKAKATENPPALALVLAAATPDRGTALLTIREFLLLADQWLTSKLAEATGRSDVIGDAAAGAVQSLLEDWASLIETEGNDG